MLLMLEKGVRSEIRYSINKYATANNKYMKDYDKSKESSCLKYLDLYKTEFMYNLYMAEVKFIWLGNVARPASKWLLSELKIFLNLMKTL